MSMRVHGLSSAPGMGGERLLTPNTVTAGYEIRTSQSVGAGATAANAYLSNHFGNARPGRTSACSDAFVYLRRQLADIRSCICHSRPQSTMAPPLRLATVPVIALAWSDARNAAALASSASVVRRLRCVMLSRRA